MQRRFESSKSTGSEPFFLLTCLDANNCSICLAKCLYSYRDDWPDQTKALSKNSKKSNSGWRAPLKNVFYLLLLLQGWFHKQTKNLGPVNFVPKSRLPIVQVIFTYRKTTAKAWNCYQRWLCRNGTRISIWNISSRKTGLPFQMFVVGSFLCSERFFSGYSGFPLSSKTNIFQIPIRPGRRRATLWMCYLQIIIYLFIMLRAGTIQKVVFHLLSNQIFRKMFCKW